MKTKSTTTLKDPSVANNGGNCYIIIHVCPPNSSKQQPLQTKGPDHVTKCSVDAVDSPKLLHLTDTRSTQVYPYDLDSGNFCHLKNQSTQTDQLRQRDHGVQTTVRRCSQSSSASQTPCYLDINSRLRPFSDKTTNAKRLTKLKPDYDGPIMHGPFSCDCPGDGCIFRS
jgi:hypothetical protein